MKNLVAFLIISLLSTSTIFAQTELIAHRSHSGKDFSFKLKSAYSLGMPYIDFKKKPTIVEPSKVIKTPTKSVIIKDGIKTTTTTVITTDTITTFNEKTPTIHTPPKTKTPQPQKPNHKPTVNAPQQNTSKTVEVITTPPVTSGAGTTTTTTTTVTVTRQKPKQSSMLPALFLLLTAPLIIGLSLYIRRL